VRNSFSSFSKLSFSSLGPGLTQGEIIAWLMEWQLNSRKDDDKSWDLGPNADKNRIWLACLMFGQGASLMFQVIAWFFSQNFFEEISELEWIVIRIGVSNASPQFFQDGRNFGLRRPMPWRAGAMVQRPVDLPGPVASGPNMPPFPGCPWSAESCASHDLKKVTWRSGPGYMGRAWSFPKSREYT
jgi:hypothetical protein